MRGAAAGFIAAFAVAILARGAGAGMAEVILATGAPVWVGIAAGPVVMILLAALAVVGVWAYGRRPPTA
jgi:hypothetical protein